MTEDRDKIWNQIYLLSRKDQIFLRDAINNLIDIDINILENDLEVSKKQIVYLNDIIKEQGKAMDVMETKHCGAIGNLYAMEIQCELDSPHDGPHSTMFDGEYITFEEDARYE